MRRLKVIHPSSNTVIGENIHIADDFVSSLVGLMFKKSLKDQDGLLIENCRSIHTCFMRFPIDVVFLDKDNNVVKVLREIGPWKFTWFYLKARKVLELNGGTLPHTISAGDRLEVVCIN